MSAAVIAPRAAPRRLRKPGPLRVSEWAVIVPEAQVHLLELQWQLDVYEAFHTARWNRLSHIVCFYPLLWTYFAFGACVSLADAPLWAAFPHATRATLALGLLPILATWYLLLDRLVGLVLLPVLVAMALSANVFAAHFGGDAAQIVLLAVVVPNMVVLTLTHGLEPMPPPWSGSNRFVPMQTWRRTMPLLWQAKAAAVTLTTGLLLEYWAAPRFVPIQVLKILHLFGYKREMTALAQQRARALHVDFTTR
ncbi:MAG: hypothetical protein QM820_46810 [Minicystis sp.]